MYARERHAPGDRSALCQNDRVFARIMS